MTFRTIYGRTHSENGWRNCNVDETETFAIDGTVQRLRVRKGPARVILEAFAIWYHRNVEPLDRYRLGSGDDWGWSATNDVASSNHLSGTSFDGNATQYPWGRRVMPLDRVAKVEEGYRLFEGTMFWGRWWDRVDEMHHQIGLPEGDPRIQAFADKLLAGHLGLFGPADPDAFPLPDGWYFGPLDGPNESISNAWQPRPEWVAALKRYQRTLSLPESGVWDLATSKATTQIQIANGWPLSGQVYRGEWDVVIRHGQRPDYGLKPITKLEYPDVSEYQGLPLSEAMRTGFVMFRVNNGNVVDRNAQENLGRAAGLVADTGHPLQAFGVYTFWRPGADNFGTLKRVCGGGKPHPRMIVMLDVEGAKGSQQGEVRGDQSAGAEDFYRQVLEWMDGDTRRVQMGYHNLRADPSLWLKKPAPDRVKFVVPDYSAPKGQPKYPYPGWRIHQYTDKGRCAPWPNGVDMNFYDGTLEQFMAEFGLDPGQPGAPAPQPPPAVEPTAPAPQPLARIDFPLPDYEGRPRYYGPLDGPMESVSGKWSGEAAAWQQGLRIYQERLKVPVTGTWEAGGQTDTATRKVQADRGWPVSGYVYRGEWDAVVNGDHPPLVRAEEPAPQPAQPTTGANKMSVKIKDLTGPGTSAQQFGIGGTDLGIATDLRDGQVRYTLGDTFDQMGVGGPGWRSPVILKDAKQNLAGLNAGITFDGAVGGAYARQVLPYEHGVGFSTVLPTDVMKVGGTWLYMHVMVIGFGGLADVRWTELQYSENGGETWTHCGPQGVRQGGDFDGMFQMLTMEFEPETDTCYVMTSAGLARNRGVYLWRAPAATFWNKDTWSGWGWNGSNWGWDRYPSNIMPAGVTVGELNLRKVQNNWVFTYFETSTGRIVSKVLSAPNANIGAAPTKVIVTNGPEWLQQINPGNVVAQPYGGYLIPGSTLAEPHYVISQWDTVQGDNWPYRAMQFRGPALTPVNPV